MISKLFKENTNDFKIQLFRYLFVGGFAFIVQSLVLTFFQEIVLVHYLIASSLGFLFGLVTNYFLSVTWVFNKRGFKSKTLEFLIFAAIGVIGLIFYDFFMWLFIGKMEIYYQFSNILSTALVLLWNFTSRRFILFSK